MRLRSLFALAMLITVVIALITLDNLGQEDGAEVISIVIADQAHSAARPFHLGAEVA